MTSGTFGAWKPKTPPARQTGEVAPEIRQLALIEFRKALGILTECIQEAMSYGPNVTNEQAFARARRKLLEHLPDVWPYVRAYGPGFESAHVEAIWATPTLARLVQRDAADILSALDEANGKLDLYEDHLRYLVPKLA